MNKEIIIKQIETTEYIANFRDINKFIECCKVCPCYNKIWSCPPYLTESKSYVDCKNQKNEDFKLTTIIGVKINISPELREKPQDKTEHKQLIQEILTEVRREIDPKLLQLEEQNSPSLLYYAGTCILCFPDKCKRANNEPCLYPEKMRSTLEADGFDIGRTCSELLGIELIWCDDLKLPEYFTLVYGFLSNTPMTKSVMKILETNPK